MGLKLARFALLLVLVSSALSLQACGAGDGGGSADMPVSPSGVPTEQVSPDVSAAPTDAASPSGGHGILVARKPGDKDSDIPLVDVSPDGAQLSNVLQGLGLAPGQGPNWINGNGDWVVVQFDGTLSGSIGGSSFSVGARDTSDFTQGPPLEYLYPRVAPDGRLFAVAVESDTGDSTWKADLVRVDPNTGEVTKLHNFKGYPRAFWPSSDFTAAVVGEEADDGEAILASLSLLDGASRYRWSVKNWTRLDGSNFDQSSDGGTVVYRDSAGYPFAEPDKSLLVVVDVGAGKKRVIATSTNGDWGDSPPDLGQLSVSPDGSQVLATRKTPDEAPSLSVFSTSTGKEVPLTADSGSRACFEGTWLPSGQIVFFSYATWPGTWSDDELWIMDADGSNEELYATGLQLDPSLLEWSLRFRQAYQ